MNLFTILPHTIFSISGSWLSSIIADLLYTKGYCNIKIDVQIRGNACSLLLWGSVRSPVLKNSVCFTSVMAEDTKAPAIQEIIDQNLNRRASCLAKISANMILYTIVLISHFHEVRIQLEVVFHLF